jgi:hypothetical protein
MINQHYSTKKVIRQRVKPGMTVRYQGKTYRASANKNGKLYIHSLTECKRVTDAFIEITLNAKGEPLIN